MNRQLATLARLYGIQTSYWNSWHERRIDARPESILAVLTALGAPVRRMDDVAKALDTRRRESLDKTEPVLVAWDGAVPPDAARPRNAKVHFVTESGAEIRGAEPGRLPLGYHSMLVQSGRAVTESLVISAPRRAAFPFDERVWGAFAPLYALRSTRRRGAGDLTDFETFSDWILGLGGRVVATLPLLATFLDDRGGPFDPSPYAPVSRLFWNEFHADPRRVPEFAALDPPDRAACDRPLPEPRLVDYPAVMKHRRGTLEAMAAAFFDHPSTERRAAFDAFRRANPDLDDYARFRAVADLQGKAWRTWPARLQDGLIERGDYAGRTRQYHSYAQWIVQEQLERAARRIEEAGAALYLDLPLGLNPDGYDTWRQRDLFVEGMAGGAPPDPLFTSGQNWGFPPIHPETARRKRHAYTIACVRNHLKYGRLLRIDHVMGLHRLFWIPDGAKGREGVYVEYPAEEHYAILCLESHRAGAGLVGENLGTVPPEVDAAMRRHNLRRLYVAQYEIRKDGPAPPPADTVVSLNTHDTPPFRGFLEGRDIRDHRDLGFINAKGERAARTRRRADVRALRADLRRRGFLGRGAADAAALRDGALRFLASSGTAVTLVNVEDLWLETEPQNVPATSTERPNWKRRLRRGLKAIQSDRRTRALLKDVDRTVAESAQSTPSRNHHAAAD